ncbi:MAG TPA: hypothetical protein VEA63_04745, partial [Opitutus sp.]|nr:hypothetical protein [Opitutus sp.]
MKRWSFPRLPVLIGVIGLGAAVTSGTWAKRRIDARQQVEAAAIREEMKEIDAEVFAYRSRMANLRWNAAKMSEAVAIAEEPLKSWARERARRFAALVGEIERARKDADASLTGVGAEIEALCARAETAEARERLARLRPPKFPEAEEFLRLQAAHYLGPLAQFSRQNPDYYRALKTFEPEASVEDVAALRRELAAAGGEVVTPQTMLGFELLSAVVPPGDPLLADWATLVSAPDFFENPDPATVTRWRRAQKAVRAEDWPTAVAQMQAIVRSKVRTRQPFRAAYGRAILRNTPDDAVTAYPFMQEAAAAGDVAARAWVSEEDFAKGKHDAALPWLEARASDGETEAVAPLLVIYAMTADAVPRDAAREAATLQKIAVGPDAPAEALVLLARLYESGRIERSAEKAFVCYQRAAEKGHIAAAIEAAERQLRGVGTTVDLDAARA